ncbi:phospholipid phosphatase-related protein type 4 isoform X2 [Cynoglossus semilaevis]|uniref:Phospholipid phosphatase-related protein type 3 n=1 Tax=Cynoglossus semilaevis TaxID=244447 RepID=A0A3P8X244_CYNSE|nr:phospholipid phosphatase-related protein type 4-like isoform X2 [Cynoglossus semilaevis]
MSRAKERLKSGKDTKDSVTLLPCFYFVELPILASSVVSLYFLELTDIFQPVHSGYSCNDRSLSLPYILPRQEVCPLPLLFSLAFAAPTVTILIGEAILYCYLSRRSAAQTEANINAAGCNFNSYIRRAVRFIGVHVFGLCVTALITDILQLSTGQHTPYWLDVCKPNLTHINMSSCDEAFILEDICSGQDAGLITAGRKSFPSQHATLAAFAAVYISMYFNTVLTDSAKLLKPLLVFSFIMLAILAGLTRIIQFRNHPVDVYCGWLLGAAIAVYLSIYAVGNFQPSEDRSRRKPSPPILREPPISSLPNISQTTMSNSHQGHHTLVPSQTEPIITRTSSHTLSPDPTGPILKRSASYREPSLSNLKRASAEVEVMIPSSPPGNQDNMVTFSSSTLPRSHGGSMMEEGRMLRRHAAIHASMDSTRSKQLLSQWKNKNENRKLSLQAMDGIRPQSLSSPQRNMELRCSSEPSAMGLEVELRGGTHLPSVSAQEAEFRPGAYIPAHYVKLAASSVPMANHNNLVHNGNAGLVSGARVSIQSRPGSSQLVHIPEEENFTCKDQESESEDSVLDGGGSVREKWLRVAEKTTLPCRPLSAGGQPRLMQVITLSKHQGLIHSPRSEDGGSTVSCSGSIRYRALMDQDPSPPASTTGAIGGGGGLERSGSIVRVEAHPENRSHKPIVKPPATDGSGSWRWKPSERASLRQSSFPLNDLNRHTDSCDSLKDGGSVDGQRSVMGTESENEGVGDMGGGRGGALYTNHPHALHPVHPLHPNNSNNFQHSEFNPNDPNNPNFNNAPSNFNPNSANLPFMPNTTYAPPFHPHPQAITTIRVTPVEVSAAASDTGSDCQSVASSSRESTLRRKNTSNIIHVPDRGPTPDLRNNHRVCDVSTHVDQESSNSFHEHLRSFQENPIHPIHPSRANMPMQGLMRRPSPTPPPTLPRPILTRTPPPSLGYDSRE